MARKQKKYHYIYKTTCDITGRYYIGMHSTDNLDDGYMGSGKRLWHSLNYHGKENHEVEILEFCENREDLKKREAEIVDEQLLSEDLCMNLMTGGQGGFRDEEHYEKFREGQKEWLKTKWGDEGYRKDNLDRLKEGYQKALTEGKLLGRQNFKGKSHSDETKKKLSEIKRGTGVGKENSQYGTCWITNGEEVKKIKKEDLNIYLEEGWKRGRK